MAPRLVYLYCIGAPAVAGAIEGARGIEEDAEPFAIERGGLVAVVSEVDPEVYGEAALAERLGDVEWTSARALGHEQVVQTCCLAGPTVPLRFGTLFAGRERIARLLDEHGERLRAMLDEMAGKAEWGVRVIVDPARFGAWATAHAAKSEPAGEGAGGAGRAYLERKRAAQRASQEQEALLAREIGEIQAALTAEASDVVRRDEAALAGTGLVLDLALLVPLARRERLETTAAEVEARGADRGLRLRVVGPWPPYSFVRPLEATGETAARAEGP